MQALVCVGTATLRNQIYHMECLATRRGPVAAPVADMPRSDGWVPVEGFGTDFMPSERFAGARSGFVFRSGERGTGYYRDGSSSHT